MLIRCFHKSKGCNLLCSFHLILGLRFCSLSCRIFPVHIPFLLTLEYCQTLFLAAHLYLLVFFIYLYIYLYIFLHPFHATTVPSYSLQFCLLFMFNLFCITKKLVVFTMLQNVKKKIMFLLFQCLSLDLRQTTINYTLLSVHLLLRSSRHFL